ncbi:serine/threonine-protein kinase [Streptomyces sulphureus]|uniref:serine/threonine-protein kinase n=1 Tax=Streptomyces sulphureus TaxID=47758 RepID=UPI0003A4B06F|nr:serine/threonine-protein kinase [Streptomyces sulphureus]
MSEDTGRLVGGRYRLEDVLGRGGMGTVWRGKDEILGRTVAVKELRFPSSVDEDEKQRLITRTLREAKAIARIRSGSAITVFDVVDEDGRPWIVMELVEGHSLADRIKREGTLTPRRAAEVGLAILDVLRAAHREGILHRDVKPSNVLLEDGTGRVVLTDFGIAKVEGDPSVTSTGMLVGAPSYISPERARGKRPGPPADLWSLGGLLYAAVEGHPPYDKGSAISTLTAVMTEPVPSSEKAGELSEVIAGLLVKDPEKRLDVDGARALLEPVAAGSPVRRRGKAAAADGAQDARTRAEPGVSPQGGPSGASSGARSIGLWKRRGESSGSGSGERLRGALKSVRNAAAGAAAGGAAAASGQAASGQAASNGSAGAGVKDGPDSRAPGARSGAETAAGEGPAAGAVKPEAAQGEDERAAAGELPAESRAAATGDGSGGRPAPERGGSAAITSLRDLQELPELRKGVSRRVLAVAAAVLVVLVAVGAVLFSTGGDDGGDETTGSAGSSTGDAATSGGKEAKDEKGADKDGSGGTEGAKDDKPDKGKDGGEKQDKDAGEKQGKDGVPDGYEKVSDGRFHFAMAMPEGFERVGVAGRNSGGKYATKQGGLPRVQVDYNASPLDDAAGAWRELEPAVSGSSPGYHLIGIDKVGWRDYPTVADWQFTRSEDGGKVRVLNRGFKVDGGRGYAIMITCKAGEWGAKECKTLRDTAFRTFQPKG